MEISGGGMPNIAPGEQFSPPIPAPCWWCGLKFTVRAFARALSVIWLVAFVCMENMSPLPRVHTISERSVITLITLLALCMPSMFDSLEVKVLYPT
jgi:hypothetical protein